jgi:hypothetical protein
MPAPVNTSEFLDLVRKSGVVDDKRLDAHMEQLRAGGNLPTEPGKLAGILVRDGLLTNFQVEQFLLGKWRRFTIGKYRVLERLGAGGMGSVYLCEHKFMRRRVAVKVLPAAKAEDPSALERFYREARAVAALDHPNIVRAYDIDQDEKLHFLVMEYVDGTSLQEIVKKCGPMDVVRSAHYVRQAAVGLQHAHEAGLVHRDIKPGNLLVDRNGVVKVLDMGLARFFNDEADDLTKKHDENVLGTADYLAPEQALDSHAVDIRADIYSLGATFYFMLTGNTPFNEGTVAQKLIWHQTRQPKSVRSLRPDVPEGIEAVINKMMAKDPAQRHQAPAELIEALAPWAQTAILPPPAHEMPRLCPAAMMAGQGELPAGGPALAPAGAGPSSGARQAGPGSGAPRSRPPSGPGRASPATPAPRSAPAAVGVKPASKPPGPRAVSDGANAIPEVLPAPGDEAASPWEQLAPDTSDLTGRADTSPRSAGIRAPRPVAAPPPVPNLVRSRRRFWVITAVVIAVPTIAVLAFLAYQLFQILFNDPTQRPAPQPRRAALIVSQSDGGNAFKSLHAALAQAKPGDHIIVRDPVIQEPLSSIGLPLTDLTIEAGSSGVEWRFPDNQNENVPLLTLVEASGLHLKGFRLDGMNRAATLVTISGNCPGLILEDIELKGFTRQALLMSNCTGANGRRVALLRVRISTNREVDSAVTLDVNANFTRTAVDSNLTFDECRFEGPCKAAMLVTGPTADVEVKRSRFFQCSDGILVKAGPALARVGLNLSNDTFYELKGNGLHFEAAPIADKQNRVALTSSLFAKGGRILTVDVPEKAIFDKAQLDAVFASQNNARMDGTQDGNVLQAREITGATFLSVNPTDAKFLRYDANNPLNRVPGGPVGLPPG